MTPTPENPRKIRLLVVDDSPTVRLLVTRSLAAEPGIEVVAGAADPFEARDRILELKPDVLTLDLEMPRMDGLTFLRILMAKRPMPVIVMSSLTQRGSILALEALQAGAVDVLAKPHGPDSAALLGRQLAERVRVAHRCRLRLPGRAETATPEPAEIAGGKNFRPDPRQIILLGASTGGTEALREVLTRLPDNLPPIAIVQHIPASFSRAFAERLNSVCRLHVREAQFGDVLQPGTALVAPGDFHLVLRWTGSRYEVGLNQRPHVWHQRPAVDILFKSAAESAGRHCLAGLLTGMGRDGANGLLRLRQAGAFTFAQDEASCVVYGMPRAAAELNAACRIVSLEQIPRLIASTVAAHHENPAGAHA